LYMRGFGPAHHVHITHRGEPAFLGFAFEARSREDLDRLAASDGFTPVERIDAPGGGWRTTTRDPHGVLVEVVHGIATVDPLGFGDPHPLNMGSKFERIGKLQRIERGPSHVKRFGHIALNVKDVEGVFNWYHARFGLIVSDRISMAPGKPFGAFTRCDRGIEPADHHSILFASDLGSGGVPGLNHVSWEVRDIDDVHAGSEFLARKRRIHEWGIGRHLLGSQVFDYWRDPWGHIHEHWTDGDQLDASVPAGDHSPDVALASQWGPNPPPTFGRTIAPEAR
ncbi:MAG TPA: VOC family protein, partial [Candidatus Binataceae bacterium]|nr:VOC family protein [Candidatus Binataceae bacterium]